jgi:hypothetical protein
MCNREKPPMGRATGHRQGCNGAVRAHQRARRLVRLGNTTRSKAKQSGWAARPPIRRSRSGRPHQMDGHPPSGDKIPLTGRLTTHDTRRPLGVTTVDVVNGVSGLPTSSNLSPPSTTVRVWRSGRVRRRAHVGQVVVRRPRSLRRAKCTGLDRATTRECSRRTWRQGRWQAAWSSEASSRRAPSSEASSRRSWASSSKRCWSERSPSSTSLRP